MLSPLSSAVLAVEPEDVTAGPLAALIVVLMGIATVFLVRNMNGRLRRLPREFPPPEGGEPAPRPDDDDRPR
jgi:hypothetical protein